MFQQNLTEIKDEITALSTIKSIMKAFLERLHLQSDELRLLDDESLLEIVDSLTVSKINFRILLRNWVMNNDKYEHDWHSVTLLNN